MQKHWYCTICILYFVVCTCIYISFLPGQWKCCMQLIQMLLFNFLIYLRFSNILIWLTNEEGRTESKRNYMLPYLYFSLYVIIFRVNGWLIQWNSVSKKRYDRVPWSCLLLRMPLLFFLTSMQILVGAECMASWGLSSPPFTEP